MENIREFSILLGNKQEMESKLASLSKKAIKIGLPEISFFYGEIEEKKSKPYIKVYISGPTAVKINGWEFIAVLEHLESGDNLVRAISNVELDIKWRSVKSECDHCNTYRQRNDTYLVQHESGEIKQVGSTCLKEFVGDLSPDNVAIRAQFVSQVIGFMRSLEFEDLFGRNLDYFSVVRVLEYSACSIDKYGFVPKSREDLDSGVISTSTNVLTELTGSLSACLEPTNEHAETAKLAKEWIDNLDEIILNNSNYLYSCHALSKERFITPRHFGFVCSIVSAYLKEQARIERINQSPSEWIGDLKQRINFGSVMLKRKHTFETQYGMTFMYVFETSSGSVLVWKASSNQHLTDGAKCVLIGTVKDHTTFRDIKQTMVSRCKVI